ncbi:DoxX family membrane protein [Paenibacillus sp. LHD-117]|uniref:DoxX family membrane protein n=1 Tax=Paenibacillus sp. LHD-117 TaxID=3071412 RepID=UPI0027E04B52|nr:DoxX family membrane protein [Paenibacillus sp. LHD-117]MDQ6420465.1 DoxX family membrane protein [Paenibacillus sp. LHD-117]
MKKSKLYTILRVVFGFMLVGSGFGMLFGFTTDMEYPSASATAFMDSMDAAGYFFPFVGVVKIICGLAILLNRYAKAALVVFMPVSVNMAIFHLSLDFASGIAAYMIIALNTYLLFKNIEGYRSMLQIH